MFVFLENVMDLLDDIPTSSGEDEDDDIEKTLEEKDQANWTWIGGKTMPQCLHSPSTSWTKVDGLHYRETRNHGGQSISSWLCFRRKFLKWLPRKQTGMRRKRSITSSKRVIQRGDPWPNGRVSRSSRSKRQLESWRYVVCRCYKWSKVLVLQRILLWPTLCLCTGGSWWEFFHLINNAIAPPPGSSSTIHYAISDRSTSLCGIPSNSIGD